MANHPQAEKRARQNATCRDRNRLHKASMRTAIKKVRKAISDGDKGEATRLLNDAVTRIQKTASRGAIHKNKAARTVSRLMRAVAAM